MKKSIRKPLNWQDFESLCKMLWGEIWNIPDKIKKNGRLGQPQAGVDVYGIPQNKLNYYGIQCKGKDDYSDAKLTKIETDKEINKAVSFQPNLETFIFATTANKDANIETYVRKRDLENRKNGGFEILIYCWEDIADLIEVNRNTFNYYVLENQFNKKFDVEMTFCDGKNVFTVHPKFKKTIITYKLHKHPLYSNIPQKKGIVSIDVVSTAKKNQSWSTFGLSIKNTGFVVIEDYKIFIYPDKNKCRELSGYLGGLTDQIFNLQHSPIHVFEDEQYACYLPKENAPLIQEDMRSFDLHILTMRENYEMQIFYKILARDFNIDGELLLKVEPEYIIEEKTIYVDSEDQVHEDKIIIDDIITFNRKDDSWLISKK
ncbi:MAG: hypothetical protein HW421_248 [Ignavibacteria bacterium]|nr:hypothetical protein [Ignavibacteria bacterium]